MEMCGGNVASWVRSYAEMTSDGACEDRNGTVIQTPVSQRRTFLDVLQEGAPCSGDVGRCS